MILKLYSTWCIMTGAYCFLAPEKAMANGLLLGMTVFGVPKGPIVFFAFVLGMIVTSMILKLYSTWCIMTGAYCFLAPEKAMANGLLLGMTVFGVPKGPIVFFAFVLGMIVSTLSI
eukprot:CAMPEP_0198306460 /NCGR_PEP_ID=MMETSP1449-20131203/58428_1 /TAXON_ID=420275 /ORGANISM="Attheya septentrionalis, Strain CCMP2084" /LENGTH=115 /DNA_ID=CAMNT_0044009015 /DNA_START=575 /DNA_END=922 /DNA_ORIENTATION=+